MSQATTEREKLVNDFFDLVEHQDRILGRELQYRDMGKMLSGPITGLRQISDKRAIITVSKLYRNVGSDEEPNWELYINEQRDFNVATRSFGFPRDGRITVVLPGSQAGKIPVERTLPDDEPSDD